MVPRGRLGRSLARSGAALRERVWRAALCAALAGWAARAARKRGQRAAVVTAARLLAFGSLARAFRAWRALAQVGSPTICAYGLDIQQRNEYGSCYTQTMVCP